MMNLPDCSEFPRPAGRKSLYLIVELPNMSAICKTLAYVLGGASAAWIAGTALAAYPERPIRIVVPLPAGTSPDLFARHLGQKLSAGVRQPVIIENRPGANSVIGTAVVAKASADGYTLLNASVQHVMLKPLLGKLAFDPDADFVPVVTISATEMILVVAAASRFGAVAELVAAAKAKPGELNFSTPGIGSPAHLAGQAFLSATGSAARHIPMKGSTESVTAVAGNQVDYTITAISNAVPLIQGGKLRPLASTGPRRHDQLPAVPTMREALPPGFIYETWQALFAPAGTPRSVLELLNREFVRMLDEADTREFFDKYGSSPRPRSLAATGAFVREESRKAVELVKAIGATAQ
jgi:tripartite-type tricarboxylate transporter receptor subunit TctC